MMKGRIFSGLLILGLLILGVSGWAEENTIPMSEKDSAMIPTLEKGGEGGFESLLFEQRSWKLKEG